MELHRRDFLSSLGGLVAASSLPAIAAEGTAAPKKLGRLVNTYQRIDAGATAPFSILHISDTHLTAAYPDEADGAEKMKSMERRTRAFGGRQEQTLRDSLAWAKEHVDYVLHIGDLIDWQSDANFDLVKKYYGREVFGSMGNHEFYTYLPDEKHTWQEPFKERSWPILAKGFPVDARFSARTINGVNFVCLDDVFGTVQPDLVERFHAEVKKGLPVVLCMHVPFFTEFLWMSHERYWRNRGHFTATEVAPEARSDFKRQLDDPTTRDFIAYLKKEPLLKGILAGHLHMSVQERFSPTATQYVVSGNYISHGQEILFT